MRFDPEGLVSIARNWGKRMGHAASRAQIFPLGTIAQYLDLTIFGRVLRLLRHASALAHSRGGEIRRRDNHPTRLLWPNLETWVFRVWTNHFLP